MRMSLQEAVAAGHISRRPRRKRQGRSAGTAIGFCPIEGHTPQEKLWRHVVRAFPGQAVWEYPGAVPGRRFRLDIAFPQKRLAVEVDGYAHHGKYLSDFKRDRERQNLLTLQGWRILRYHAGEIHKEPERIIEQITRALSSDIGDKNNE